MEKSAIKIPSISCGHCIMTIEREVGEVEGVSSVVGDEETKMVTVEWDAPATWDKIADTLKESGYPAEE